MSNENHILALTSVADTQEGFLRLQNAVCDFNAHHAAGIARKARNDGVAYAPQIILSPREAMQKKYETVPSEKAIGRTAAELITNYPPGIAQIVPGEQINIKVAKQYVKVVE
jgi:lysine decarboxylase